MPESRFLKIIIIVLLLINIGTLGFLWLGRPGGHGPHPHMRDGGGPGPFGRPGPPPGPAAFLHEALQLTDSQENAYHKMREAHHQIVMAIRDQMRDQKRALYALMKSRASPALKAQEQSMMDSLAAQQRRIEDITYEHFREVRAICDSKQQQKFDEVIGEALEQMR